MVKKKLNGGVTGIVKNGCCGRKCGVSRAEMEDGTREEKNITAKLLRPKGPVRVFDMYLLSVQKKHLVLVHKS